MNHKHACGLHCLQIENLSVAIDGRPILRDIALHAHCGELTVVIGRNGAGKSTLMKALVGELPYSGTITFSGHGGEPTPHKPRCGYVPQSLSIDRSSPTSVKDMLLCYTSWLPVFLPRRKKTVEALKAHLAVFGADDLLNKRVGELSGGELQRVLLSLATWNKPDMVLLDEPVSGVDNEGLLSFYELMDSLRAQDMLTVLISHDLTFVREYADRVVLLENGTVAASGRPDEVFATQAFASAFPVQARKEAQA